MDQFSQRCNIHSSIFYHSEHFMDCFVEWKLSIKQFLHDLVIYIHDS